MWITDKMMWTSLPVFSPVRTQVERNWWDEFSSG